MKGYMNILTNTCTLRICVLLILFATDAVATGKRKRAVDTDRQAGKPATIADSRVRSL